MISRDKEEFLRSIVDLIDFDIVTPLKLGLNYEEIVFLRDLYNTKAAFAKSEKKEEVMDKYMIIIDNGLPIGFNNIVEAKCKCEKAIEAGCNKATIYEKKFVASVVKPKVEFKEV